MIDRSTAKHFSWGHGCDGWRLVSNPAIAVIEEQMPPGTAEVRHYHRSAHQFFYVLRGELTIETDGDQHRLRAGQGLEIAPGVAHEVANHSAKKVEFLLVSTPPSDNDRVLAQVA